MQTPSKVFIVGIGASAGGLEAISLLISQLRTDTPCAYVVLQHLSPTHRSMMVEILRRETPLTVKEAEQGETPQAGVIYVVPSNYNAILKEGRLQLQAAPPEVVPKPSINQFLISLAAEEGEFAIGIVLSGTGSDGVAGLRAIQAAGGFTLAQRPETAKYDGMPRSAIDARVVDHILSPQEIALQLPQLIEQPAQEADLSPPADLLDHLLAMLRDKLQFDFSGYKIGTLMRRVRRREIATGNTELAAYIAWAETHPQELELLARDILISVTAFFRDRDAFESLKRSIAEICTRKAASEIRIWVAGCASGEEAYSIAILVAEALREGFQLPRVQIFATDIDDEALNVARRGIYPAAALAEIPPDWLERYFTPSNQAFEVSKTLRDMIVFARHNLVSDPPFLRLDLVTCRNVLIYFDNALQAKVLQTFHFGLQSDGYLFLGRSESVTQADSLFGAVERRDRLFRKRGDSTLPSHQPAVPAVRTLSQRRERKTELLITGLIQHFDLAAVLCDADGNVLHSAGPVEHYLQFPSGLPRLSISEVAQPALRAEILTLLYRCSQSGKPQHGHRRKAGGGWLRIHVEPVEDTTSDMLLVLFVPEHASKTGNAEAANTTQETDHLLENELVATREHLQNMVEEMATANEEMQALNEEAQASNEELQATNEELEAANEELQATNEELISLNEELNVKTAEYALLSQEYAHLYDALEYPIMVFDRALQLVRFNLPAAHQFDLRNGAIRQHVSRLKLSPCLAELEMRLGRVLAHADREETIGVNGERVVRLSITPGINKAGEVTTLVVSLIDLTDISRAQSQLSESQARLSALMEKTTIIFAMKDAQGHYQYANRSFLEFFGLDEATYKNKTDFDLLPQELANTLWSLDLESLRSTLPVSHEHIFNPSGKRRYLRTVHQVIIDSTGKPTAFMVEAEDITARKHAEELLRITAQVFDQAGEAIVVTSPDGVIQTVNHAFTLITGYPAAEALNQPIKFLKSGRHGPDFYEQFWQALNNEGFWQGEIWNRKKNGEVFPEWLTVNRVADTEGRIEHFVAVFSDISSIKMAQGRVEYLATHDTLTGLPNRTLFHDHLRHAIAQSRRNKSRAALMYIDLDNFKTINDTLGHDYGDELLRQAGARLKKLVRDVDTVARLGGDEFTAVLSDCSTETAEQVGQRIVDDLSASFEVQGKSLFVSASVGVAFYPDDGKDTTALIKAADSAMYRAKESGRNRLEFFKPDLHIRLQRKVNLENGLREALRQKRLRLVYQPKHGIASGYPLVGAEALLRWTDPVLGEVSPAEFIPVAETCGLILEIDDFVTTQLIEQVATWKSLGLRPPPISLNASPRSIHENRYATHLLGLLRKHDVEATQLIMEITEGALLEISQHVSDNLMTLSESGIGISIDDFGTGYSSLSYLKRLPLTELKLDKSFVDGLGEDREDEAIARAILAMTQALGLKCVAEGVETDRQLAWLSQHGCNSAQGYYFAKPLESPSFEDLIARHQT